MTRESERIGEQVARRPAKALGKGDGLLRGRVPGRTPLVRRRQRQDLLERHQDDRGQTERQSPGERGAPQGGAPMLPARPGELEEKKHAAARDRVEQCLGVAAQGDQAERHDHDHDRRAAAAAGHAAQTEEQQRKCRNGGRDGITEPEDEVIGQRPGHGAKQRRSLATRKLPKEQVSRKQGEQKPHRHLEGPGLGEGKNQPEPCQRMQRRRLLEGEQRLSGHAKPVPERESPVANRLPNRLASRNLRAHDVCQERRPGPGDPGFTLVGDQRLRAELDVERRIHAAGRHRGTREKERAEHQGTRNRQLQGAHPAVRDPQQRRGRDEIDGEQAQGEHEHAARILFHGRPATRCRPTRIESRRVTAPLTSEPAAARRGDAISIDGAYQHRARTRGFVVQRSWHYQKERVIRKFCPPGPGDRVIDVGCGSGVIADLLASMGARTTGIDANPAAIAYARQAFSRPNLDFQQGLVEDLPFEPGSLDKIYCLELIEHIYAHQVRSLLQGLFRLARPGGRLFVTTPNYRSFWPLLEWTLDKLKLAAPMAEHQHVTRFSRGMLASFLQEAGWQVETVTTFSTFAPFLSAVSWTLAERCAALEDRASLPFGNILLAIARKPGASGAP